MLSKTFTGTVLVLDLDETLVHIKRVTKAEPTSFTLPPDFSWQPDHDPLRYYIGWKRPGFDEFFDHVFEEVDAGNIFLCIWTTAAKRYATKALQLTLGSNYDKINLIWTREEYQKCKNKKDLCQLAKFLECPLSRMVMVDDNSLVFHNYLRAGGIVWLTPPFNDPVAQQDDRQLFRIWDALERRLHHVVACRTELASCEEEVPSLTQNVRKFRQVMVNWVTLLHLRFNLDDISLHVAFHILDELFIHEADLIDNDPIAVATTCLYIGCCYGESSAVQLVEWIKVAGGHIEYDDIVTCLQQINHALAYPLVDVGHVPLIILKDYLAQVELLSEEKRAEVWQRAQYVLELCLLDFRYRSFEVKPLVWSVLCFVFSREDERYWKSFPLAGKYHADSQVDILEFVEIAAVQGDRPILGRNESNERHQRKFNQNYGEFSNTQIEIQA